MFAYCGKQQKKEWGYNMGLNNKQFKFTRMVALLIQRATDLGYELTFGDAYAQTGHMINSLHYKRLAVDFNLFKDGVYLTTTKDHEPLGEFWEAMGGTWGGRFNDGNHYSLAHDGIK